MISLLEYRVSQLSVIIIISYCIVLVQDRLNIQKQMKFLDVWISFLLCLSEGAAISLWL